MCVGVTLQCGCGGVVSVCRLKHYSLNKVIIKQVASSLSLFTQLDVNLLLDIHYSILPYFYVSKITYGYQVIAYTRITVDSAEHSNSFSLLPQHAEAKCAVIRLAGMEH